MNDYRPLNLRDSLHVQYHGWTELLREDAIVIIQKNYGVFKRYAVLIDEHYSGDLNSLLHSLTSWRTFISVHDAKGRSEFIPRSFKSTKNNFRMFNEATYAIDLSLPQETLWSNLTQDRRRTHRLAIEQGLHCEFLKNPPRREIEAFYEEYRKFSETHELKTLSLEIILKMFSDQNALLAICKHEQEPTAYALIYIHDNTALYLHGVDLNTSHKHSGPFLHCELIQYLKQQHIRWYDLGGVLKFEKDSIHQFKKAFGGNYIDLGSEWDYCPAWIRPLRRLQQTVQSVTPLFSRFLSGGALSVTRLFTGLIRVKYLAVALGVAGIGLLSQVNLFYLNMTAFVSLVMATGVISRLNSQRVSKQSVLTTTFLTQLALTLVSCFLVLLFREQISEFIFHQAIPTNWMLCLSLALPFSVFASGYLEGLILAHHNARSYSYCSILASLTELTSFFVLIPRYGITGYFASVALGAFTLFTSFAFVAKQKYKLSELFNFQFKYYSKDELFRILKFSVAILISTLFSSTFLLLIRGQLIKTHGLAANGLIQVPIALSAYILPFVTNILWNHLHPTATKYGASESSKQALTESTHFSMVIFLLLASLALQLSPIIIPLFYSNEFVSSIKLLPLQLFGDFFFILTFTRGVYLLGVNSLRRYVFVWTVYCVLFFVAFHVFKSDDSIHYFFFSYIAAAFLANVISALLVRTKLNINLILSFILLSFQCVTSMYYDSKALNIFAFSVALLFSTYQIFKKAKHRLT